MDIYSKILFFVSAINFILAVLFFLSSRKQKSNMIFAFFIVFISLWSLSIGLFLDTDNFAWARTLANIYYVSGGMIGTLFLFFSQLFIGDQRFFKIKTFIISLPMLIYIILFFINDHLFIQNIYIDKFGKNVVLNKLPYILFLIYFALYILIAYVIFLRKYFKSKNIHEKRQIRLIVTSTLIGFFFSFLFNLYLPFTGVYHLIWIGPLFGFLMAGTIFYAIAKYQIFNIKTVATELFIFIMWIAVFIQILFEDKVQKQIQSGALLVFLIVFGVLLIRSVIREVEQRELLQSLKDALQKSNTELGEANEQLKSLDKLKTEFLSLASHQLRSPLTAIKGYSSMLIEDSFGEINEHQKEAVKRIYTSAQGLVSIVEDLLDVTKIEQGGMKYQFSETDIKKIVSELYNEMLIPAQNKGLTLSFDFDDKEPYIINADTTKIKQVFLNLVDNAIKYTKEGFVKIKLYKKTNRLYFSVQDSGLGVTPETKKRLFQKFSRGEAGKTNTGGSGLGLYIAQKIVEAHKGVISIESEGEGKGTVFTVAIPYN